MLPEMEQFLDQKRSKTKRQHKTPDIVILLALPMKYQCFEWSTGAKNTSKCEQTCTQKARRHYERFYDNFGSNSTPKMEP